MCDCGGGKRMENALKDIDGIVNCTRCDDGTMSSCTVNKENILHTSVGDLTPRYSPPDYRTKNLKSMSFYGDGAIKSVYLDKQTEITTPRGVFPAELVTFHPDGSLSSLFPLNGQIGFTWSEEEEGELAPLCTFDLTFGTIEVRLNGVRFNSDGSLKSILFWPGQTVVLETPLGSFPGRHGVRLYEDGALKSFEPAIPVTFETPVGAVQAYDVMAVGVDADINSVVFDQEGSLHELKTSGEFTAFDANGAATVIESRTQIGMTDDELIKLPLTLSFEGGKVRVDDGAHAWEFPLEGYRFMVLPDLDLAGFECSGECGTCSGCE